MTMIACPECKKEYSDQSDTCVHCGARNPYRMSSGGKIGVGLAIVVGFLAFLIAVGELADPEKQSAQIAIEECRRAANDMQLSVGARNIARGTCERMEQRYRDTYNSAP